MKLRSLMIYCTNDYCPHTLAGICTYHYILEPWTNPELAFCNPHGSHNLTTMCSVTASESSFTLEWYYSKLSSNAGHSGRVLNNIGKKYFVTIDEHQIENETFIMLSHLIITNVTSNEFGYYWCMVRVRNSDTLLPNPSRILHLSNICDSAPVCNSSLLLYHPYWPDSSCANHDNMNIIFPETLQCIQPTSMPENAVGIQPNRTMHPPPILTLQSVTGKSDNVPSLEDEVKTHNTKLPFPHSTIVFVFGPGNEATSTPGLEDKMKTSTKPPSPESPHSTIVFLNEPGNKATSAPGLEDKMETSTKLPSSHSTVVYTEPLPTDVVSGGDSDTRLIWLYVGIAMAVVLTAIAVILSLIICIQCKKWGVKGVPRWQLGKVGSHSLLLSAFVTMVLSPRNS